MLARALVVGVVALVAAGGSTAGADRIRPCSHAELGRLIVGFVGAFNAGRSARLDALFARDDGDGDVLTPSFQWYSTAKPGARLGDAAENRANLIPYFRRRHAKHERLRLLVWHGRGENTDAYADFAFTLVRTADDARRPLTLIGKGAAICTASRNTIAVWSM
jgi:hypothetical protein